jgi:hypothetical protein
LRAAAFGAGPVQPHTQTTLNMEAEQLNALTNHLRDLQVRNLELRRYL